MYATSKQREAQLEKKDLEIKIAHLEKELGIVTDSFNKAQQGHNMYMTKFENSERLGATRDETHKQLQETKKMHIYKLQERLDEQDKVYAHIINANEMKEEDLRSKCVQLQTRFL